MTPPSKTRILIADDHEQICQLVVEVLSLDDGTGAGSDGGFEVVATVRDGPSAIDAAKTHRPDVVVLDHSMPGLTGIQACQLIRAEGGGPHVVFLSAYDHPAYVAEAFDAGAVGYVLKTRLVRDIRGAIRSAVEGERFLSEGISVES